MDYLGREVANATSWARFHPEEENLELYQQTYVDFFDKLQMAEDLFDWGKELVETNSFRKVLSLRLIELDLAGLELYHWSSGLLGTLHEGWACLLLDKEGDFIFKEGSNHAGCTHTYHITEPGRMAHFMPKLLLEEVGNAVKNDKVYRTMSMPLWQVDMDALIAADIISGEWIRE